MELKLSKDGTHYLMPKPSPHEVIEYREDAGLDMRSAKIQAAKDQRSAFRKALMARLRMVMKKDRTLEWRETERDRIIMTMLTYSL